MNDSPFKFLDAYTKEDRDIFFGRDKEVEELYRRTFEQKIVMVYGGSGTGKSSLVMCGLANKFREADWLPLLIRRRDNLMDCISNAVKAAAITPINYEFLTTDLFKKAIKSLYIDYYKPIYFIFDQFEELFLFGSKEEKSAFVQLIRSLSESDIECRFIFIMREEYMANVNEFEKLMPGFLSNRIRIEKMSRNNAIMAIKGPCAVYGIEVEDGFSENLIKKLSPGSPEIELTYLQIFLDKIFNLASSKIRKNDGQIKFSNDLLNKTGDVSDLLGSFLDEQILKMPDREAALTVLKSFVSIKGTKRQLNQNEAMCNAVSLGKPVNEKVLSEMINRFVQLRILRDKDMRGRYELRHDALAAKIYEKISIVEKEILDVRHFLENAYTNWQKRNIYLSPSDLKYISPYRKKLYLSKELDSFITASEKALSGSIRRRRNLAIAIPSLAVLVLTLFTAWALVEKRHSDTNYRIARANYYGTVARETSLTDPTKGLRIAEYAANLNPTMELKRLIHSIYMNNSFYKTIVKVRRPFGITASCISPDGKSFLVATTDNMIRLYDLDGNLVRSYTGVTSEVQSIAFSPKGNYFLTGSRDFTAALWNTGSGITRQFKGNPKTFVDNSYINAVAFSPGGDSIITCSGDPSVILWDINGKKLKEYPHKGHIRAVAFSPSGKLIATGEGFERRANIWDVRGGNPVELYGSGGGLWSVKFSPDGKYLLSGSTGRELILWDLKGNIVQKFFGSEGQIRSVAFSPDGKYVLSGSLDNSIRLWNLQGENIKTFLGHHDGVYYIGLTPDGHSLLSYGNDNTVRKWDVNFGTEQIFKWDLGYIRSFTTSPDNKRAIVVGNDYTAWFWNIENNHTRQVFTGSGLLEASYSPDGNRILTIGTDGTASFWDNNENRLFEFRNGYTGFLSDGHIWTLSPEGNIHIYDTAFKLIRKVKSEYYSDLDRRFDAILADDSTLFTWHGFSQNYLLQKINLNNGTIKKFVGHTGYIRSIALSPDRKSITTGSIDRSAIVWNMDGKPLQVFRGHEGPIITIRYSSDGKSILTRSSPSNMILLWDQEGVNTQIIKDPAAIIQFCQFWDNDKSVLTVSADGAVRIWDILMSVEEFQRLNQYDQLDIASRLGTGMSTIKDVRNSEDPFELFEAGKWFYENKDLLKPEKSSQYLDYSKELLEKALSYESKADAELVIQLHKVYSEIISESGRNRSLSKKMENLFSKIDLITDDDNLKFLATYFIELGNTDTDTLDRIEDYSVLLKITDRVRDKTVRADMLTAFENLSSILISTGNYREAISVALKGNEINEKDYLLKANLVLAYVLDEQIDKAVSVLRKNSDYLIDSVSFEDYVFSRLENKNVSTPVFERLKEKLSSL